MRELGVSLDPEHLDTGFPHPSDPKQRVFVMFDICHMLKLIRGYFSKDIIFDKDGGKIMWSYVDTLHKLQEKEGLHLANKLKLAHIHWHSQKMKVKLAAQVLSQSVADAIEFLDTKLHLPEFKGSGPTVKFIRIIDRLFDLLNSRNPSACGFKAPLREIGFKLIYSFLKNKNKLWQFQT